MSKKNKPKVICPHCGQPAVWVPNSEIYGKRYGKSYMVWLCRPCGAYVGCHNNTKTPLGTLANAPTREARKQAHAAIDPVWKSGHYERRAVYQLLRTYFGREIHIGESSIKECQAIIEAARVLFGPGGKETADALGQIEKAGKKIGMVFNAMRKHGLIGGGSNGPANT